MGDLLQVFLTRAKELADIAFDNRIGIQILICLVAWLFFKGKLESKKGIPYVALVFALTSSCLVVLAALFPEHIPALSDLRFYIFLAGMVGIISAAEGIRLLPK